MHKSGFIGSKLRLARLFHGYTQADLGGLLSASRQYIHQLESGIKNKPADDMLDAMLDVLEVNESFFYTSVFNQVEVEQCHFRKQKSSLVSTTNQVISHGTLLAQFINCLDDYLSLPPVDYPQVCVSNSDDIEDAASECRRYWNLSENLPISNVTRVIENAGTVVTSIQGVSERIDAFSIDRIRPIIIRSNIKNSPTRIRFDLAHELGHLVMHQGIQTGDDRTEKQAHRFAGAFLFPKANFINEFPKNKRLDWTAIFNLKRKWNISVQAIIMRARDLDLINSVQFRTANAFISKNGYRKNEPYESKVSEQPELLQISLDKLSECLEANIESIAASMGVNVRFISKLLDIDVSQYVISDIENIVDIRNFR